MRTYRGNLRDQWVDFKYWAKNWLAVLGYVAPHPIKTIRAMVRYPWIYDLLKVNHYGRALNEGRNGMPLVPALGLTARTWWIWLVPSSNVIAHAAM